MKPQAWQRSGSARSCASGGLVVSEDRVRKLIRDAAAAADDLTNDLLEFSDGPIDRLNWLKLLARSGTAEARIHRAFDKVSIRLGLPKGAK